MICDLRTKCNGCIWFDMCKSVDACDGYTPYDDMDDIEIEMMIELRRDEYRLAWIDYVSQYE